MHKTVVINVVGLTPALIGSGTPNISRLIAHGRMSHVVPVFPAVTCTVQSSMLTGRFPDEHGIVGNGWYDRQECEIKFWKQSNRLVAGQKVWDKARGIDPGFTCANLFWWYNMYSTVDLAVTPRPMYLADGRKVPDIHTHPPSLRDRLQEKLGRFPLFKFWGPGSSIESSKWIASAAIEVDRENDPTLSLIYLPHLDYTGQQYGPNTPQTAMAAGEVDAEVGRLIKHFDGRARIILLSEYGLTKVDRPIHVNRVLREAGLLVVRVEDDGEKLDCGASAAFAVADHQVAHVYINDPGKTDRVNEIVKNLDGVAAVYHAGERSAVRLNHERAGDIVLVAEERAWFTYYYWLDDAVAPAFARTVDIHRKPGYDPAELFIDPKLKLPKARIAWTLLRKKLGQRALLNVIPLDANLVRGSHGRPPVDPRFGPVVISSEAGLMTQSSYNATQIYGLILDHLQKASTEGRSSR